MKTPKYRELAEGIRLRIENGELPPETRLPPIRACAKEMKVNTTTVIAAYKYLESLNHVYSRVGSGTYVSPFLPETKDKTAWFKIIYFNFAGTDTDPALFPADDFNVSLSTVLKRDGKEAFAQDNRFGYTPLREILAERAQTDPERVVLLTDTQQGYDIYKRIRPKLHIEEDMYGDFYYDGKPRRPSSETYIKSYAKIFMPGLAYTVVPKDLVKKIAAPVYCPATGFVQRAFDLYLRSGKFDEHAAKMRTVYGKRYRKVIAAARAYLSGYVGFDEPECGLGIEIRPKYTIKIDTLCQRFLQRKVVVFPGVNYFNINFATTREERITEGIGIIAAVLAEGVR
jgi:DNA-binding transcriptional MocR family regulator